MKIKFNNKINNKPFKIVRYTNFAYIGNLLCKEIINLKKAREDQKKYLKLLMS